MAYQDIRKLIEEAKYVDALVLARKQLVMKPGDIWIKRGASWAIYYQLKENCHPDAFSTFVKKLKELDSLQLASSEVMVFDRVAGLVGKMVFALKRGHSFDPSQVEQIFISIRSFSFSKPSSSFSFLLKAMMKGQPDGEYFLDLVDWWGFSNFCPKDFQETFFQEKKITSLVEKTINTYAKQLIILLQKPNPAYLDRAEKFIPVLNKMIQEQPQFRFVGYYKAKILFLLGEKEEAKQAFIPFAKKKQKDFWVWSFMADLFADDPEIKFACFCKALLLPTPAKFLVKMRETFVHLLLQKQLWDQAKLEVSLIAQTQKTEGWKLSKDVLFWENQSWYQQADLPPNNNRFYHQHAGKALEVFFLDTKEEAIVVTFLNKKKKILNFIVNKDKHGFFRYDLKIEHPKIGDVFLVRMDGKDNIGFFNLLTIRKAPENTPVEAIKSFQGKVVLPAGKNFGFVEDVFLPHHLLQTTQLSNGQQVRGKAVCSFNKAKNEWGWQAFFMEKNESQ